MRTGVDIMAVDRIRAVIERHGDRFLARVFTAHEQVICGGDPRRLAGRYAAKEAVAKALGTGIGRSGIRFLDIEIKQDEWGAPVVSLHRAALERYQALEATRLSLSLSHEHAFAIAFCVLMQGIERDA